MNRIIKKAVSIIIISCLAVGLCACQKNEEPVRSNQVADTGAGEETASNVTDNKTDAEAVGHHCHC